MNRRYWVVSPNVKNNNEQQAWKDYITQHGYVFLGPRNRRENEFLNTIKIGDCVIIAQGANWQKRLFIAGIVDSDAILEHKNGTPSEAHNRKLNPWIDLQTNPRGIEFSKENYGGSSKDPGGALYELNPDNPADLEIIKKLESAFKELEMENILNNCEELLKNNYNLVLTGAPGTGKTYMAYELAMKLTGSKTRKSEHIKFVQFHPSYDYADFVEGVKPSEISTGIKFKVRDGVFKEFCQNAAKSPKEKFVFIIDEINRADLSRVFGELFFGLEADYRGEEIITQYSYLQGGNNLVIPQNLYIIGTMNDIDRSVESMDFALRRRFVWKEISAESSEKIIDSADISKELKEQAKTRMNNLNAKILEIFGSKAYQIGGAYFKKLEFYKEDDDSGFLSLWENHLENVLREYFRGNRELEKKIKELETAYNKKNEQTDGSAK